MIKKLIGEFKINYLILTFILFLIFISRFPSLFEPFWYGDEGIFAAVARNLNQGGVLYATAWDNKPPMIYLTYALIFKFFGVSMFWLRLVTLVVVLSTATLIYEIAKSTLGEKRALWATLIFGILTSLRIIEGNLALTEIFMILPITLAMFLVIFRKFDYISLFVAGILFAGASLYKQVGALEAAALGLFIFLATKNFLEFVKKGAVLALGFLVPFVAAVLYFAPKELLDDYIFAAYTYYQIYLDESPRRAIIINFLKFAPVAAVILYGLFKKFKDKQVGIFHLFLLWTAFSFLGSFFSGRTYGHYLVQAVPAVSIVFARGDFRMRLRMVQVAFASFFFIPILILTKILFADFLSGGPVNQISYWQNFGDFMTGKKGLNSYNDYFDQNVNSIMALSDFLVMNNAKGQYVYIWGDYPWLYAISDVRNPTRYVTSFHVFGVPNGKSEVEADLLKNSPIYIIKPANSIGYFVELERLTSTRYTYLLTVENSRIFMRTR